MFYSMVSIFYHRQYDDDIGIDWDTGHNGILHRGYSGKKACVGWTELFFTLNCVVLVLQSHQKSFLLRNENIIIIILYEI